MKPCIDCPFRSDIEFVLSESRTQQIARDVIRGDEAFHCHKTTEFDNDGSFIYSDRAKPCIGAIKAIKKERGDARASLWVRLGIMTGMIDLELIDNDIPVYDADEFVESVSI
jgi:hypothetical protein